MIKPDDSTTRRKLIEHLQGLKNVQGRAPIEIVTDEELEGIFAEARDKHLSHFDLQPISDPTQDAADVAAFDWGAYDKGGL